jgi:hypothetical protein
MVTQGDGQTIFTCQFPICGKEYASRDAFINNCRVRHLEWLQSLE